MKLTELKTGTKLQLIIQDKTGEQALTPFASEFEWADEEGNLYIAAPIREGILYPVPVGTIMDVLFVIRDDDFIKIDLYKFKASVIDRVNEGKVALLKIKSISALEKIQRRQFFRIKAVLDIKYREPAPAGTDIASQPLFVNAVTRDLSGGGLCITTLEKLDDGKVLEFILDLGNNSKVTFLGKVIRAAKSYESDKFKNRYQIGIAFEKIDERDREEIIKYIFFEQRKLRKKGLI